jgi:hypothetical protein
MADETSTAAGTYRDHSIALNAAMWKIARALGDVPEDGTQIMADPGELVDRIIAELADARKQTSADPHVDARTRLAMLRALYAELADGPLVNGDWLLGQLGRLTRGADVDTAAAKLRISTPGTALWRAIDQLADALGMTWTVDDHGASVIAAAAERLAPARPTRVFLCAADGNASDGRSEAVIRWARANNLDPARTLNAIDVHLDTRIIRYEELADPGEPGVYSAGPHSGYRRRIESPLLVDPPAELLRPPLGFTAGRMPSAVPGPARPVYDWERYRRTCDPDSQLEGLGDLCAFLGGSWSEGNNAGSFTAGLLKLIVEADPSRLAGLEAGFPREVLAWRTWLGMSPTSTAADLAAKLTRITGEGGRP